MSDFSTCRVMMVDTQVRPSDVTKFPIIAAMLTVKRENFVPEGQREAAYVGLNIELGAGRVVLEPRTLAKMLDFLDIVPGDRVLDVAAGLAAAGHQTVRVVAGPLAGGAAAEAPFDAILIEGGVEQVPAALMAQLTEGGRIGAVFMEGALGTVRIGRKEAGAVTWRYAFNATAPVLQGFAATREFVL